MTSEHVFEEVFRTINKSEMAVLRDVHYFPAYGQDIIFPYMMVCINHSGIARTLYDMTEVVFSPNEVAVILPNHILHPIESSPDYHVTIIVHSAALCEELKTKRLTHDYNKFHRIPACPLAEDDMAQFMKAVELLEHLCNASTQRYPLRHEMLIELTNVMVEMHNAYRREMDEKAAKDSRNYSLFNDFCDLLATHYREEHEMAFYARQLHLTPRHFSLIIKEVVGISASDYIGEYLATQAKSILTSRPDMSVQQVSYHLGFAESPSFCRFFKRITGLTPKAFRAQLR